MRNETTEGSAIARLVHEHPPLTREGNHALAQAFLDKQKEICTLFAALEYPVNRTLSDLYSGKLAFNRERAEAIIKNKLVGIRASGIAPSHAAELRNQQTLREQGVVNNDQYCAWLANWLTGFTYDVLEMISPFLVPSPEVDSEANHANRRSLHILVDEAEALRHRIIKGNLKLVLKVVHSSGIQKLSRDQPRISADDLFMVGAQEGLGCAVNRFDPKLGAFSTYASLWIRQAVERHVRENMYVYHVPLGLQGKIRAAKDEPGTWHSIGCNENVILPSEQSLHSPVSADSDVSFAEVIADPDTPQPDDEASLTEIKEILGDRIKDLDRPSQFLLSLRYGVGDASELARSIYQQESKAFRRESILSGPSGRASFGRPVFILRETKPIPQRLYA